MKQLRRELLAKPGIRGITYAEPKPTGRSASGSLHVHMGQEHSGEAVDTAARSVGMVPVVIVDDRGLNYNIQPRNELAPWYIQTVNQNTGSEAPPKGDVFSHFVIRSDRPIILNHRSKDEIKAFFGHLHRLKMHGLKLVPANK